MGERVDCAVIGAGVVGLAIARKLAIQGREVIVLEREDAIGTITSARNSEVIHAGLYYPEGSLKARLCVAGRALLYDYLQERAINHQRCGKLIVATTEEESEALEDILEKARINGVDDMTRINAADARAMEPELTCHGALFSPSTGIFDSHSYMLNLQGDAENHGASFAFLSTVAGGQIKDGAVSLDVSGADGTMTLDCSTVINAAGLGAQKIASSIDGFPLQKVPPLHYAKGNYFTLNGKAPFKHLIYPLPGKASLGTHYTRDLGGQGRFGPDVQWIDDIDYNVDPDRAESFYAAIRRYWPGLADGTLNPAYSGIRPKIQAPGEPTADFIIQDTGVHGVRGLINLFGIESPGLTSSLAIADEVASRL
ncbi:MAG: NAD(P)/FAD-dependent oxidoreductase [Rhodospirillales bacterium]|nr:NAD(P)/FAD-dependent oxidoreductase [Rhodospirillales bacterium]MBL6942712.1 NAD(P)/FAD-dependent oxidoreductase [Rhodospirillales bacterium]